MVCGYRLAGGVECKSLSDVVQRVSWPGLELVKLTRPTHRELFASASPLRGENLAALLGRVAACLAEERAQVISLDIFGVSAAAGRPALAAAFGPQAFPVTWIEEGCEAEAPLIGVELWAVAGLAVTPLTAAGQVIGSVFEDECTRTCRLGGLVSPDLSLPAPGQAHAVFEQMAAALDQAGMDFSQVVRTWFYNDQMLDWYGPFNTVRTAFFNEHKVFGGLVPASTGVGGRNAQGGALTAGLLAVTPRCGSVRAFAVPSPLQCPALDYGSAFSRAVEIDLPDHRRLFISGTASIAPEGQTVHLDDTGAQLSLSMDVVAAILESRAMGWGDVSRVIAYFKHASDAHLFEQYLRAHDLPAFPWLAVKEEICRHDLLFEIELDAMKAN